MCIKYIQCVLIRAAKQFGHSVQTAKRQYEHVLEHDVVQRKEIPSTLQQLKIMSRQPEGM